MTEFTPFRWVVLLGLRSMKLREELLSDRADFGLGCPGVKGQLRRLGAPEILRQVGVNLVHHSVILVAHPINDQLHGDARLGTR